MDDQHYDVAVVGAGPNGLTAAAYLARAGARVVVLEQRFERGGTLASDDYSTPFLYNQAQLLLPLGEETPPYRDLELRRQAVRFVEPPLAFAFALDGDALIIERGGGGLGSELETMLAETAREVAPLLYTDAAAAQADRPPLRLATMTPGELASSVPDERAAVILRYACALAGFPANDQALGLIGAFCLARLFQPVLVAGGSKGLANGLFRVAAGAGARCFVSTRAVALHPDHAGVAVALADGRRLHARAVVSTLDPITTFDELLGADVDRGELTALTERWTLDASGPFTAHFGIKGGPPVPAGHAGDQDAAVRVLGFRGLADVAEHLDAVARGALPSRPAGHLTTTSRLDPLQASPGPYGPLHTLRYETPAPYEHPSGSWERVRIAYRTSCWELISSQVGGLAHARLLFGFADSPHDLERRFTTARRGSVRQGSLRPEQTFTGRPHPTCAAGRTPIPGLYLGGGAIHPGVPGSLAGGYHAAAAVCADLGFDRWWAESRYEGGELVV